MSILSTPLRLYTSVWGKKYIDLFEQTIIKSFSWACNNKTLLNENITWVVNTNECDDMEIVTSLIKKIGISNIEVYPLWEPELEQISHDEWLIKNYHNKKIEGNHNHMGLILLKSFTDEMQRCLALNAKLLISPPDSIFSDGSIRGILMSGQQNETCVSVAHPRVLPFIIKHLIQDMKSPELVSLAFKHLHKTWSQANLDCDMINSYVGGVQWKKVSNDLYKIAHRLPTPYLLHFNKSDLDFFKQQICFGTIDHIWPTNLIQNERLRHICSSDVAFIVEVTPPSQNIPPAYPVVKNEPDKFWRNAYHNQIFRQFNVIFRGVNG